MMASFVTTEVLLQRFYHRGFATAVLLERFYHRGFTTEVSLQRALKGSEEEMVRLGLGFGAPHPPGYVSVTASVAFVCL